MALFQWTSKLETGIPSVDNQHKKLVDCINQLHDAMKQQQGAQKVQEILDFLVSYTITHFKDEEALMAKKNYPDLAAHKMVHEKFVREVQKMRDDFKAGRNLTLELSQALTDWLKNHIMGTDMKYVSHLK